MLALRIRPDHARHAGMSAGRPASQRASSSRRHAGPTWGRLLLPDVGVARGHPAAHHPPEPGEHGAARHDDRDEAKSPAHCASSGDTGAGTTAPDGSTHADTSAPAARPTPASMTPVRTAPSASRRGRRHGQSAVGRVRDRDRRHVLHQHRGRRRAFAASTRARSTWPRRPPCPCTLTATTNRADASSAQATASSTRSVTRRGRPAVVGFRGSPPDRPRQPRPVRGRAADGGGPDGTGRRSRYCADR